ncbi:hypothetical protein BDF14DRAFT_1826429 [Spinellus fusiger]|nr:hypothetical protein BDF14DRAFT_1826429 [Spinellus fusiger]
MATPPPAEIEIVEKRIYLGGLHANVDESEIQERFSRFGALKNVTVAKDTEGKCRGFGHMTMTTTTKQWTSCLAVYNGAKWKGTILKLEEAKEDYLEKKRKEEISLVEREEKRRKRRERVNESDGFMAKNMKPVTDSNMKDRKGWKRGRYGRAIAVVRLKRDNGTTLVFDPSHYKNNLTKLYNIGGRMKSLRELPTRYEDYEEDRFDTLKREEEEAKEIEEENNEDKEYQEEEIEEHEVKEQEDIEMQDNSIEAKRQRDNAKRLAALEQKEADQTMRAKILKDSFAAMKDSNRTQHISFETESEELSEELSAEPVKELPRDAKWMFDSDEEDDEEEISIKINPVLEGEMGQQRLALQSRFKGDERFKLGEDFIDQNETENVNEKSQDDIARELTAEKDQSLDILKAMFGERGVVKQKTTNLWNNSARFDPDAKDANSYKIQPKQTPTEKTDSEDEDAEDIEEKEEEEEEEYIGNSKPSSAVPIVSKDRHFAVNVNLKPLFGTDAGSFKLFGKAEEEAEAEEAEIEIENENETDILDAPHLVLKNKEAPVGLGLFFFFHMEDPSLLKK